jgi:hypothetical protein
MNGLSSVAIIAAAVAGFIAPPAQQTTYAASSVGIPSDAGSTCRGELVKAPVIAATKYNETAKFVQEHSAVLSLDGLFERTDIPVGSGYHVIQSSLDFLKLEGHPAYGMLSELIYDPDEDLSNLALTFLINATLEEALTLGDKLTRRLIREGTANTPSLIVLVDITGVSV